MIAKQLKITGRVQGVGFRDWLAQTANSLGVSGWVRNRLDGSVEAIIAGTPAQVEDCIQACQRGPRLAAVDHIDIGETDPPQMPGFMIRPTA